MQRRGEIGPSLARFMRYQLHARDLELRKARKPSSEAQARRWESICATHEALLDEAWEEVGAIAEWYGDEPAQIVVEKYLWDEDWHDIAATHHLPYDLTKKMAYRALAWLDVWRAARMPPFGWENENGK